jgi:SAM-dependent methyltransferase
MTWKDLFSEGAASYARFRPRYPAELFRWLAAAAPDRRLAVDVGAGNAQAARALVGQFARVIAVEPSAEQIRQAGAPEPGLELRLGSAEALPIDSQSADLILAAQAFHWFRADQFFAEVARASRPAGVLALCCYQLTTISLAVDEVCGPQ